MDMAWSGHLFHISFKFPILNHYILSKIDKTKIVLFNCTWLYIIAYDFSTRSSIADSHPVKIDKTPPEKSDHPIKIEGRHLSNLSEINAWYV